MSFCGCFKCCCSDEDSGRRKPHRQLYENEGFEKSGEKYEDVQSPEEKLWGSVLGELKFQFESSRDPYDDLTPEKSMAWVFKVLKPAQIEEYHNKTHDEVPAFMNILKSPKCQVNIDAMVMKVIEDFEFVPLSSKPSIMSNTVPSIGKPAPIFKGKAVVDGEFKDISLLDYAGKYVVLFFYPLDFTFVCPTEIIAFSDRAEDFRFIGCELVACSTDSHFSHLAWVNTERKKGGLGSMNIPLLADKSMDISKAYGVLKEDEGIAYRGLFIIDGNQNLRQITINDLPVGRDVDETFRLVQAFQFTDEHGEVCPAGWKPGSKTMKADPKGSKEYFSSEH